MAQTLQTSAQLKALSTSTFPDNTTGQITAAAHRTFNETMVDSTVRALDWYSTSEQPTGEMWNGKPIYTRMFTGQAAAGGIAGNGGTLVLSADMSLGTDAIWISELSHRIEPTEPIGLYHQLAIGDVAGQICVIFLHTSQVAISLSIKNNTATATGSGSVYVVVLKYAK